MIYLIGQMEPEALIPTLAASGAAFALVWWVVRRCKRGIWYRATSGDSMSVGSMTCGDPIPCIVCSSQ